MEKKLEGLVAGLMEDVSWEDVGNPYPPLPTAFAPRLLCFMPEWNVDLSGTLRENDGTPTPPALPPLPTIPPLLDGDSGSLL